MIAVLIARFWKARVFWIDTGDQVGDIDGRKLIESEQCFEILRASCGIGDLIRLPVVIQTHFPGRRHNGYRLSIQ